MQQNTRPVLIRQGRAIGIQGHNAFLGGRQAHVDGVRGLFVAARPLHHLVQQNRQSRLIIQMKQLLKGPPLNRTTPDQPSERQIRLIHAAICIHDGQTKGRTIQRPVHQRQFAFHIINALPVLGHIA